MLKTNIQFVALVRADDKLWKVEDQIGSDVAEDPPDMACLFIFHKSSQIDQNKNQKIN